MKKIISLSLSALLLLALTVSGCQQESAQKPEMEKTIANRLAMTPEQVSAMADGVQDLDLTSAEGENTIVHVRQSFGNQRELYILYDVTFSEKIDLDVLKDGISPITLKTLSPIRTLCLALHSLKIYIHSLLEFLAHWPSSGRPRTCYSSVICIHTWVTATLTC